MLMVGCRSDRNLNPSSHTFAQGSYGSSIVMMWLGLCLNYYLVFADACKMSGNDPRVGSRRRNKSLKASSVDCALSSSQRPPTAHLPIAPRIRPTTPYARADCPAHSADCSSAGCQLPAAMLARSQLKHQDKQDKTRKTPLVTS